MKVSRVVKEKNDDYDDDYGDYCENDDVYDDDSCFDYFHYFVMTMKT